MTTLLPTRIPIPLKTASELAFIGDGITARDISYAIAVMHLATVTEPDRSGKLYRIPDNGLRAALGLIRRDRIDIEVARFERMRTAKFKIGDRYYDFPDVYYRRTPGGREIVERHLKLDDKINWTVSPLALEHFMPDGGPCIELPLDVLQKARKRHSIHLAIRMLAWMQDAPRFKHRIIGRTAQHFVIRIGIMDLVDALSLPRDMTPSALIRDYLAPINGDLEFTSIDLQIEPRYVSTIRNPKGRVKDFDILIGVAAPSRVEMLIQEREKALAKKGWRPEPRKRGRPKKPKPAPASTDNVVAFDPGPPMLTGRPGMPKRDR